MAKFVLTDASVTIGGTDLSDHIESVTINYESETGDSTSMGDDTRINIGGLKNWSIDINFRQDFASSSVDDTLFDLVGTTFTVVVKPTSAAVSTSNPSYTGTGLLSTYNPLGNTVGDVAAAPITIMSAGTLARATA